ncbi:Glutaminyl-peptide cyclotransferase [Glycine soja]|uniref:Glutaminyl-peptide cyclotransferase n=1 Tax=Glycine soja TaxID=3848 RepID=A0A445J0K5_GLYSO|nr:Glutaminyl-peptide cyclotransferase [Glycine soja]
MNVALIYFSLSLSLSPSEPSLMAASKLFSASLLVSMVTLLVLSSDKCLALQCGVSYETITVVNEFPHDPQAFTQHKSVPNLQPSWLPILEALGSTDPSCHRSRSKTDYLHGIKSLTDELAITNDPLDDVDLVIHTLNGLSAEYKEVSTALHTHEKPIDFEELHDLFLTLRVISRGMTTTMIPHLLPLLMQYTRGLLYTGNDTLFESTGLYGESSVRKVALCTGKVDIIHKMDDSYFGEGLTLLNSRLFQVTWLRTNGFIYDPKHLSQIGTFNHDMNDGWGLATDGKVLFGSDGSSTLYQMIQTDPQTFKAVSKQVVYYKGHEVHNLNELEYINGEVWANVLPTDCIVRISPSDGSVLGWILLQDLKKELVEAGAISEDNILNGIAWDGEQKRIFVTGKLWPKLYEIKVSPIKEPIEEGTIEQLCLPEPYVPPSNLVLADPAQRE